MPARGFWGRAVAVVLGVVVATTGCTGPAAPSTSAPATASSVSSGVPATGSAPATAEASPTQAAPLTLTVMSFNILTGRNDCAGCKAVKRAGLGKELKLGARMPQVAKKIALAGADIIGFQENEGPGRLPQSYLAGLLRDYTWVQPTRTVPMAVRSSRFQVVASGIETIEARRQRCTSSDKTDGRYATWARLRDRASGNEFLVYNTHLHPYDTSRCAKLRSANIKKLTSLMARKNPGRVLPQVVTGDFNASGDEKRKAFSTHLTGLAKAGLVDTARVAARDASDVKRADCAGRMTATVKGKTRVKVIRRSDTYIDYVWVSKGSRVASWAVQSGPGVKYRKISGVKVPTWTGVMASDHSPVVARVTLPSA